jgi:diaminopimelate decarboxylase
MMNTTEAYARSGAALCEVARARLASGHELAYLDFGGGFGIDYGTGPVQAPREFALTALSVQKQFGLEALAMLVEPGRSLVGSHGVLVASVIQAKVSGTRRWLMIDAGMNDLIRPALYGALHRIEPLEQAPSGQRFRVVGPVCESSDDFGEHLIAPEAPRHIVIRDAGAYGFVMSSEYNGRALPSEIFAERGQVVKVSRSPGARAWIQRRLEA